MKVVIFCGGLGVRMGEQTQRIPKPMINVGNRPILWHIMKWYASWGHNEFILCLGLSRRKHQGVLPQLQRGPFERLRPLERRSRRRVAQQRHLQLARHLRGHRHSVQHRRAAARGRAAPRRRRRFLANYGDGLTDRPTRHDRPASSSGKTGQLPLRAAVLQRARRRRRTQGLVRSVEDISEPTSGSTAASSSSGATSSTTSARARTSSTSRSSG